MSQLGVASAKAATTREVLKAGSAELTEKIASRGSDDVASVPR
jgi:hypothetical protein